MTNDTPNHKVESRSGLVRAWPLWRGPTSPSTARRPGAFYGWWMVLFCSLARAMTAPGQTIGISAFIDEFIDALDTSRSSIATAYMIGTLVGAAALPFAGRWIDRAGVGHTMTIIVMCFAVAIAFTGTVQNVVMLGFAFVGLRMLGQGALSLSSTTGIVVWFEHRRGLALAVAGMVTLGLISLAPLTFGALIQGFGWRMTWFILAGSVAVIMVPLARLAIVDRPEAVGQVADGAARFQTAPDLGTRSSTVGEALRTPSFWTLNGLVLLMAAVGTGLTFHNTDLLVAQGLTEAQAAAVFLPQAIGSVFASFVVGWMTDRCPARSLMFVGGLCLGVGSMLATTASPGVAAMAYGATLGLGMGSMLGLGALYPKWFGVDHIGSIKGIATTLNVAASAVGPLVLSIGKDIAGSYTAAVTGCSIAAFAMAIVALVVPTPSSVPIDPTLAREQLRLP